MHPSNILNHYKSKVFYKNLLFLVCLFFYSKIGHAQELNEGIDSLLWKEISALVYLDSITIKPEDPELNVDSFVRLMLEDESFYQAFRNLRFYGHQFDHDIRFKNRKNQEIDYYTGIHAQEMEELCREMLVLDGHASPKYYNRKNEYSYLTSKIIDRVFYTQGKVCADTSNAKAKEPINKFEGNIEKLKTVIFKPGRDVNVPLVGGKLSIFSQEMRKFYNYSVTQIPYNGKNSYIFEVELKPEYTDNNTKTVIRRMSTYFDPISFKVLAREYRLLYKTGLYSFDIDIDVTLTKWNEAYLPKRVRYSGYWKHIGRKAERCDFTFIFSEFNL